MGEDQSLNVADVVAQQREVTQEAFAKSWNTGIYGSQATAFLDQIPVDQGAPEPVDTRDDVTRDDDRVMLAGREGSNHAGGGRSS
jgi:hypothetical protein